MRLMENYANILWGVTLSILAASWWVIRNVLTNNKKIELLEQKTEMMHELLKEVRNDQKQMQRDLQNLASR
jgi:hypothetical protein